METPTGEGMDTMTDSLHRMETRLEAAAALLERTVALMEERTGDVGRLVAAVETRQPREAELEQKLQAAEQQIAELRAQIENARAEARAEQPSARKTVPAEMTQFLSRQGITTLDSIEAGALDTALTGLSLEQRLAVKAQLLRAGVMS